jgi:sortase B
MALLVTFAVYALWDSKQIYNSADSSNYLIFKPTPENEGKSFKELQAINPEVIAWLTVFGTNIDYPITQGKDNIKYVNTNAEGKSSLVGSIFLDSENNADFCDFNNILYGHHMEKKAMFGEIGDFAEKTVFETHRYGNLHLDGKDKGIEFFAFVHADAYDSAVFAANVEGEAKQVYLNGLFEKALYTRDISVTVDDRIILLSTCSSDSTNGRDILVGRITDEVFSDPFLLPADPVDNHNYQVKTSQVREIFLWLPLLILVIAIRLIVQLVSFCQNRLLRRKIAKHTPFQGFS